MCSVGFRSPSTIGSEPQILLVITNIRDPVVSTSQNHPDSWSQINYNRVCDVGTSSLVRDPKILCGGYKLVLATCPLSPPRQKRAWSGGVAVLVVFYPRRKSCAISTLNGHSGDPLPALQTCGLSQYSERTSFPFLEAFPPAPPSRYKTAQSSRVSAPRA